MGDILKEAIADAKAVRETALENAKMALEEAFTPQIKSMLSAKLKEDDMDDEAEEDMHDEGEHDDEAEEGEHEEGMREDDDEAEEGEREEGMHDDEAEEGMHDDEAEEAMHDEGEDDEEVEESNLDLEAIIKELEAELTEDEDEDEEVEESTEAVEEGEEIEEEYEIDEAALTEEDDDDEDKDEVDEELDKSSDIGKSDNNRGSTDVSSGIGKGGKLSEVQAELKEYKEAVSFLKDKLHEVNILNAKLLFTNKLFKSYSLDNNQKLKVVETFDRAQTTREIKLVYSTLAEQFSDNNSIVTKKSISESASAPVGSTKPSKESSKVITEESQVANRFKKLAGLL